MSAMQPSPALTLDDLRVTGPAGVIVGPVSLLLERGEILGIVGESGSGKSLTALAVAGLLPDGLIADGRIMINGEDVAILSPVARRQLGGRKIGYVFQDPLSSFNPVRRVGTGFFESAKRHRGLPLAAARALASDRLAAMHLADPQRILDAYPHQLSGGQRQRAMIALALLNDPPLLIADEPTTALDATVQRTVLGLIRADAVGRGTVFITHDLGVAVSLCDRIAVMRHGKIVEVGSARSLISQPTAPYTRAMIAARLAIAQPAESRA